MYEIIQHQRLESAASSITFSNIPQIYTDLLIKTSLRDTGGGNIASYISFNGSTANFSGRYLYGDGASVSSGSLGRYIGSLKDNATTNTFNSTEIYIPNYTSSNNKSFSVDNATENNGTNADQNIIAGLWSNTAAITSIALTPNSGDFRQGSTATLYGVSRRQAIGRSPQAVGGYINYANGYWYHTFTGSGNFTPFNNMQVEYVVVAGGGGGSRGYINTNGGGGGGGAGGYRSSVQGEMSGGGAVAESPLNLTANTSYAVTVGAGGAGNNSGGADNGTQGGSSSFWTISTTGGGGGGNQSRTGAAGGSSGGSGWATAGVSGGNPVANQGYAGGLTTSTGSAFAGAGGGGAGSGALTVGDTNNGGTGGVGVRTSITGSATFLAGGGGGGGSGTPGAGGSGGGATGNGSSGTANTGGGGGGNYGQSSGGAGGSGVVIVRYRA